MKLLSSDISPYSARVRMVIRLKGLDVEICAPDLPLRSPEFNQKYPYGKIPVLCLDDGSSLSESWSIMEYLDLRQGNVSLSPTSPEALARMRARGRYADLHLAPALFPLFASLLHKTPVDLEAQMQKVSAELTKGEAIWAAERGDAIEPDLADVALAPVMYFTLTTPKVLGYQGNVLNNCPTLKTWWQRMQADLHISACIQEMDAAFKAMGQSR